MQAFYIYLHFFYKLASKYVGPIPLLGLVFLMQTNTITIIMMINRKPPIEHPTAIAITLLVWLLELNKTSPSITNYNIIAALT